MSRLISRHASGNERVGSNFDGLRVALFNQTFFTEEAFHDVLVEELLLSRIARAFSRHVVERHGLEVVLFDHALERIALFVNHVGEVVGFFGKALLAFLILIELHDFGTNVGQGLGGRRLDAGDRNDVETEFGFHRTDNVAFLGVKDRVFKRRHHHALREPAQIAAFLGAARISRFLLGHFGKCLGIGLDLLEDFFGLGLSLVLALTEVNQDVGGSPFFRSLEAALVLFVEGLDVFFAGFNVLKEIRREHNVLDIDGVGTFKLLLVVRPVLLGVLVGDLHLDHVFADAQVVHGGFTLFREKVEDAARGGIGNQRRTGDAFGEQIAADFTADHVHEVFIAHAGSSQIVGVLLGVELAVGEKAREGLNHFDGDLFAHMNVFKRRLTDETAFVHDRFEQRDLGLLAVEHIGTEFFTETHTQVFQTLALGFVKLLRKDRNVVDLGDGAVVADHSVIGIDTCDHKAGNHEHHGDEHQPALVIAEQLKKHEISLWIKQKCGLPHQAAGPLCALDKR